MAIKDELAAIKKSLTSAADAIDPTGVLGLTKTLLSKNITLDDWNTLIANIIPFASIALALQSNMLDLLKAVADVSDAQSITATDLATNYLKKVSEATGTERVYLITAEGTQSVKIVSTALDAWSIAQRDANGNLNVSAPKDAYHAVNKAYAHDTFVPKTGGTVSGDFSVQGDFSVAGTTTTENSESLAVEDATIVTNAGGAALGATLSGVVIKIDGSTAYGILYDPGTNSVKLGLGTLSESGKFTFNDSNTDGKAIATRADSANLSSGELLKWDSTTKSLVGAGAAVASFVEKVVRAGSDLLYGVGADGVQRMFPVEHGVESMTDLDLTYGDTTVTYDTTDGIGINGQARFTYNGGTTKDVTMDVSIPVVPGNGITIDKKSGSEQVEIKADTDYFDGKYVPEQTTTDDYIYAYVYDKNGQTTIRAEKGIADNTIAIRHDGSRLYVGSPISEVDAVNLDYADKHYVGLQIPAATRSVVAINTDGTQELITLHGGSAVQGSVPLRSTGGVVRVGTPVSSSDATTKAYVDGLHHYTHTVSLTGSSSAIYITTAVKGYPNPITAIDDAGSTPSLSDLLSYAGQTSKAMATGYITNDDANYCPVMALYVVSGQVYVEYLDMTTMNPTSQTLANIDEYTVADIVA